MRQFERAYHASIYMRRRTASVILLTLLMLNQSFLDIDQLNLEEVPDRRETDYEGSITYTDNHTYATIGSTDRSTTLVMPGGHDYARPLPLVVSLHGYSGWGSGNSNYMGL